MMQPTLMPIDVFIFLTSIIFPMFGQGGGTMYVPLFSFKGFSFYETVAISQCLIVISSLSAMLVYHRARMISWTLFALIEIPTLIGAFTGGWCSSVIPSNWARVVFVVLLFISGFSMIKGWFSDKGDDFCVYNLVGNNKLRVFIGIMAMFGAGFLAGLLGIGGGVIKVPMMILFLGVPIKTAVGTSGLMVGFTALSALLGHGLVGHVNLYALWPYMIVVFVGAQVGARIGTLLDKDRYKKWLGVMLIVMAIIYTVQIVRSCGL